MMGDFRMAQKSVMYESAVRVPFLLRIPGVTDGRITIEQPVSHIDVVPTLLEAMGFGSKTNLDGRSLLPTVEGRENLRYRDVFIEWQGDEGENKWFRPYRDGEDEELIQKVYAAKVRTIVSRGGWKLSLSEAGENELYDLNRDPHEMHNLYFSKGSRSKEYGKKIEELTEKLLDWQRDTGDTVRLTAG
jgi:arylsulfatase A-like enzyme